MYAHDKARVIDGLLPIVPPPNPRLSDVMKTAERIARQSDGRMLVTNCHHVHGFWTNVRMLGIEEEGLWETIELAWAVILEALAWYQRNVQSVNPVA